MKRVQRKKVPGYFLQFNKLQKVTGYLFLVMGVAVGAAGFAQGQSSSAKIDGSDVAVVRGSGAPVLAAIYQHFVAAATRRFVSFTAQGGDESSIAKSLEVADPRVVFLLGDNLSSLVPLIAPKVPLLVASQAEMVATPSAADGSNRTILQMDLDLSPQQRLEAVKKLLPGRRRVGMIYNPKLSGDQVEAYRQAVGEAGVELVLLKVDQPQDVASLINSFKGRIDLLLLIRDATLIKAGAGAITGFMRAAGIPVVAPSAGFLPEGVFLTLTVTSEALGRHAWQTVDRMARGQRFFRQEFSPADITIGFSLREGAKLKYTDQTMIMMQSSAVQAGYRVEINP